MISKYKRIGCFVLSLVLMFLLFATPIVQPKADAFAITASVATISIVVSLLALLGISFATVDAAKAGADSFVRTNPDILSWVDNVKVGSGCPGDPGFSPDGKPSIFFNAANTAGLVTFFNKAKEFFNKKGEGNVEVVDPDFGVVSNIRFTTLTEFTTAEQAFACAFYDAKDYIDPNFLSLTVNGVKYSWFFQNADGNLCVVVGDGYVDNVRYYFGSTGTCLTPPIGSGFDHFISRRFGFRTFTADDNVTYLFPFVASRWVDKIGKIHTSYDAPPYHTFRSGTAPISGLGVTDVTTPVPYKNSPKYDPQSVIDQL
ncbi:MAG: hypothetical protein RR285_13535, partial [Acinetobacter sp.]